MTRAGYFPGNFKIPGTGIPKNYPGFPSPTYDPNPLLVSFLLPPILNSFKGIHTQQKHQKHESTNEKGFNRIFGFVPFGCDCPGWIIDLLLDL